MISRPPCSLLEVYYTPSLHSSELADESLPAPPNGVYDSSDRTITWRIPQLQPGQAGALTLLFEADVESVPAGTEIVNLAIARVGDRSAYVSATTTATVGDWPSLDVKKDASQAEVSIGSAVRYRVTVTNRDDVAAPVAVLNACVVDTLPPGFVYVRGSTRINGAEASDPATQAGNLIWDIGAIDPGESVVLHYAANVSIAAATSHGINTVFVKGENPDALMYRTDTASAQVQVRLGVFDSMGTVVGMVYLDLQLKAEHVADRLWPAGVRRTTEGTWASGSLTYELLDELWLAYHRGYAYVPGSSTEHTDSLRLTRSVSVSPATGLTYELGVTSKGESLLPTVDRRTEMHAGAGWSFGDEHQLSLSAGVRVESTTGWQITAPIKALYQTSMGDVKATFGYGQTLGRPDTGLWTVSPEKGVSAVGVRSVPQRPGSCHSILPR
jgi:uncharacterized repeat protein (TIGR01451 family)